MDPSLPLRLAAFAAPYAGLEPIGLEWRPPMLPARGHALVWRLEDASRQRREFEWLFRRPPGLPIIVVLPAPEAVGRTLPLLRYVNSLEPKAVLPPGRITAPLRLRNILATPPRGLASAALAYLERRGLIPTPGIARTVGRILELATEISSVSKLARRLCTSRRTLGRRFAGAGLPVPSHWLQFSRLLRVAVHLQVHGGTIHRAAIRTGYPDGFTMSNQMKRLIGRRPTEVREHLGWEWVVEEWIRRETLTGGIDAKRHARAVGCYLPSPVRPSEPRPLPFSEDALDPGPRRPRRVQRAGRM